MAGGSLKLAAWTVALVFFADQATKFHFEQAWLRLDLVPGFIGLRPLYNPGLFFGFWRVAHLRLLTLAVSLLVIVLTVSAGRQLRGRGGGRRLDLALGLVWGGMLGNLADRLLFESVFDFILVRPIPVFNLADAALTVGGALFALEFFRGGPAPAGNDA